jgi:hypothetical protein
LPTRLKDTQKFEFSIGDIKDRVGNPTTVQNPTWSVTDPTVIELTVAPDGLSGSGRAVGPLGLSALHLDADADLGDGVKPIQGIADFEVVAGDATIININIGAITEQDEPSPGPGPGPVGPPLITPTP